MVKTAVKIPSSFPQSCEERWYKQEILDGPHKKKAHGQKSRDKSMENKGKEQDTLTEQVLNKALVPYWAPQFRLVLTKEYENVHCPALDII